MTTIKQEVLDSISSKFEILEVIDLVSYDCQLDTLSSILSRYQDYSFKVNQRILILHHDTDYYTSSNSAGFTLYNLFTILNTFNIPHQFLIVLTNHYGIKEEIESLSINICNTLAPTVIYTALWYDFPDTVNTSVDTATPTSLFCCLNGVNRIHRLLTLCYLKDRNLLEQGVVSYHFDR